MTTQEPPGGPHSERPWSDGAGALPPPPPPPGAPESGAPSGYPTSGAPGSAPPDYPMSAAPGDGPPGYPPAGAYPQPGGYGPPPGYGPPGYPPGGMPPPRPYDPLIGYDFSSWMDRLKGVVKRSWKRVLQLILLGLVLPVIGAFVVLSGIVAAVIVLLVNVGDADLMPLLLLGIVLSYLGIIAAVVYFQAVTGLAVMKTVTNDAAGQPVPVMTTYRASLRLAWPTTGWLVLAGLAIGIGLIACILPGVYLWIALSMIVPIMAFERQGGFSGSFQLIHSNFWPAAGRILLLYLFSAVISYAAQMLYYVVMIPFGFVMEGESSVFAVVALIVAMLFVFAVMIAASVAGHIIMLCGYLVTYAELRGRLQPELTTAQLAAEANA